MPDKTIEQIKRQRDRLLRRILKAIASTVQRHGTRVPGDSVNPGGVWQIDLCEAGTAPQLVYADGIWSGTGQVQLVTTTGRAADDVTIFFHTEQAGSADADPDGFGIDGLLDILEALHETQDRDRWSGSLRAVPARPGRRPLAKQQEPHAGAAGTGPAAARTRAGS